MAIIILRFLLTPPLPALAVPLTAVEAAAVLPASHPTKAPASLPPTQIPCFDPATNHYLGAAPVMTHQDVVKRIEKARAAQRVWASSTMAERRRLLLTMQKYILSHQADICRVASRDSGKPAVDAAFGEILVTCEKIAWLCGEGEKWLRDDVRSAGRMMFYKRYVTMMLIVTSTYFSTRFFPSILALPFPPPPPPPHTHNHSNMIRSTFTRIIMP